MKILSRRAFCRLGLVAGMAAGPASSLAASPPSGTPGRGPSTRNGLKARSAESVDFAKAGYCGYRCDICPARSVDRDTRRRMVDGWKKLFGHTCYTDENVPVARPCGGCKGDGEIADLQCKARPCAREKGLVSCADCGQFPCEKLRPLLADRYELLLSLRGRSVTLAEYRMSAMQFESMPVLLGRMIETGKLPSWIRELE